MGLVAHSESGEAGQKREKTQPVTFASSLSIVLDTDDSNRKIEAQICVVYCSAVAFQIHCVLYLFLVLL